MKRTEKQRKIVTVLMVVALVSMTIPSCAAETADEGTDAQVTLFDAGYSSEDLGGTWDPDNAAVISLKDKGTTVEYKGNSVQGSVTIDGDVVTISKEGTYVLSGSLSDGQILVDAENTDQIQMVLNGAEIVCSSSSAILVRQADKTFITVADGTENKVTDGDTYVLVEGEDEPDGAIFSKDDLTINGAGDLSVTGHYKDGIVSKDDLVITGAHVAVTAAGDGLRGKDSVAVSAGAITIKAGSDGMKSTNETEDGKGWISLDAGTVSIVAGGDGVQAAAALQVTGGTYTILAGGGNDEALAEDVSAKGVKAVGTLIVTDGTLSIDAADDGLHSNTDVTVSGGLVNIHTGGDGVHADANLALTGGTIAIPVSYEALEGMTVTITGGDIDVTASDDGINAASGDGGDQMEPGFGGAEPGQPPQEGMEPGQQPENGQEPGSRPEHRTKSEQTTEGGVSNPGDKMPPATQTTGEKSDCWIEITGGIIKVNAGGDGIDANGDLRISGGYLIINGPVNGGNSTLDYDGTATITGGTLIGAGSAGMMQTFNGDSNQPVLVVTYSSVQQANALLRLKDQGGNVIAEMTAEKQYRAVIISSPDLKTGETYTLSGGTKDVTVTLSEANTNINEDGTANTQQGRMRIKT